MELEELKQFLRVDGDDMDIILRAYQQAAEVYLRNAGVLVGYENALYRIAVTVFVAKLLENPDLLSKKKGENDSIDAGLTLNALIVQLR